MRFTKCTINDLEKALAKVNEKYDNNIIFNRLDPQGFTLKVKDSKKAGHRLHLSYNLDGLHSQRRGISACWHVHGDFFDALFAVNPFAIIHSMGNKITIENGNWEDKNIGSQMFPQYHSIACECD